MILEISDEEEASQAEPEKDGFDEDFDRLFEECRPYLNNPFHERSVENLRRGKSRGLSHDSMRLVAHDEACYHMIAGLVTSLLREIKGLKMSKKEEVRFVLKLLQRFREENKR